MPSAKVQRAAPTFDLTCVSAHLPKAALPPALLTSATIRPSSIRKIKMPAVPETASIKPTETTLSTVSRALNFAARTAPDKIPINSEE